ncbi:hypothetical protein [Gemmobacter sp.]|uniref:hypothetical protein n=1 Tax=Gemmobacter sp. TaxID=1898957 RepID=UPI002AFEC093|nr:hypothetical protein [Gemmobacter sp.]
MTWVSCGKTYIEADVIRWREPIWKPQARTSKKPPTMLGFRTVAGQVLKLDRYGWVHVQVAACTVEPLPRCIRPLYPLEIGQPVRRKRDKIGQGKIERLFGRMRAPETPFWPLGDLVGQRDVLAALLLCQALQLCRLRSLAVLDYDLSPRVIHRRCLQRGC